MSKAAKQKCIVCLKSIPRRLSYHHINVPRTAEPEREMNIFGWSTSASPEKPDGLREQHGNIITHYAAIRPTTKDGLTRFTNDQVTFTKKNKDGAIVQFSSWDGESYIDPYFCRDVCARAQGYAAAQHGHRYDFQTETKK